MAVINTGIVERPIIGVNDGGDLFLDESTSTATNTGIVERDIIGKHDANFVHPLGDELISNGDFSNGSTDWSFTSGATLTDIGAKITHTPTDGSIAQLSILTIGKEYKLTYEITESISGGLKFNSAVNGAMVTTVGVHTKYFEADGTTAVFGRTSAIDNDITITNISVKEILVNRESAVSNTGIVERPITGVNESEPMFPDNTQSTVVNISALLTALESRATTFENREGTQNILINLPKC